MKKAAMAHGSFLPLPGQYACVMLIKDNDPKIWQLVLTVVDP